jgi:hypothetical protein
VKSKKEAVEIEESHTILEEVQAEASRMKEKEKNQSGEEEEGGEDHLERFNTKSSDMCEFIL